MIKIKRTKDNFENINNIVLNKVFNGHPINTVTHSIQECTTHEWGLPNISTYGIPEGSNSKYVFKKARIKVKDWLEIQYSASRANNYKQFKKGSYHKTEKFVEKSITQNEQHEIPTPVLELKPDSYNIAVGDEYIYEPIQEGRSRGIGANNVGLEWIPIWVAVRRARK